MMYLHSQYENELLFNRLIAHAAVSGKSGIAIMADMGVFCLIDRIAQLLEARQGLQFHSGGSAATARRILKSRRRASERRRSLQTAACHYSYKKFINAIRSANA
jgi:hypothetical protein